MTDIEKMVKDAADLTKTRDEPINPKPKAEKVFGNYQKFNKKCLGKINPNDPDSVSLVEGIKGEKIDSVNERLAMCGGLWREYRGKENPEKALEGLHMFKKQERGEE
jgi:hypothetical protein